MAMGIWRYSFGAWGDAIRTSRLALALDTLADIGPACPIPAPNWRLRRQTAWRFPVEDIVAMYRRRHGPPEPDDA
jgi:hypothetical protein